MKTRSFGSFSPGDEDMPAYPDEQLVSEALDDSHPAFEQLVEQYQYRVLRTIASIIMNEQAAQDVAQETFLSAWSDLAKLKEREKFGRWLNRIAINLSKDWLREQRRRNENRVTLDENAVVLTQELRYRRDELRQTVWEAIDELTADYREAVILHYISGYSYKEISEMLSVPVSTVRGRLEQARNQLRKEFLDMVGKLQLEIDSTVHKFLKERAKQDGVSIEGLILRLIQRYKRDIDRPEVAVRQVWEPSREPVLSDFCGAPSPDGRYLSFVDWSYEAQGDLAIRDLATGEYRDLTDEATWDEPDQCAIFSRWSPDGKQIAYTWFNKGPWELRIVGLDGSKPRVLYRSENKQVTRIYLHAWSQDGKHILVDLKRVDGASDIALVSVVDGSVRVLKALKSLPSWHWMSLSPDGRYVVYGRPVEEHTELRDIFMLAADGSGEEVPLVEHPADDYGPIWSPGGKSIVFVSDRSGAYDAWLIQVADGEPVGEPQLIKRDIGPMQPMGFTRGGSLYYGLFANSTDIYTASIDPTTGELLVPPTKAIRRFEGFNHSPAWSPDGKSLAYVSMRPSPGSPRRESVLMIRSVETGEERGLHPEASLANTGFPPNIRWSPDGRSILCGRSLQLIGAQTGDVTPIVQFDPADRVRIGGAAWSPDGKAIFYVRVVASQWLHSIVAHDLETGEEKELYQGGEPDIEWFGLAVSPDGRHLAFTGEGVLKVMSTSEGEPRVFHRLQDTEKFAPGAAGSGLAWTADGRYVIFGIHRPGQPGPLELWRVPVEEGEPQKLLEMDGLSDIRVHPDGRRIAFTGGWIQMEVWAMENFLPLD